MLDETTVTRNIETGGAISALVDVDISVTHHDDEEAREVADNIANAVHEAINE